jgi:hypothetical protein
LGIVSVPVKPLQLSKALSPIDVTELGIVSVPVKRVQLLKALSGILVTFSPIFNVVKFVQL